MQAGASTADGMLREAEFLQRRRRVLRAEALVALAFVLGLGLVAAAKLTSPDHLEVATAFFVVSLFGSMLRVWRIANRHWRCPACDVRWGTRETLASLHWNHCPSCGEALRVHPRQRERERIAQAAFELEALPIEILRERFAQRRRRALVWVGLVIAAGVCLLVWVQGRFPAARDWLENLVVAGFGGVVVGLLVWGMRCPRCQTGVLVRGRYCMRCGLRLEPHPTGPSQDRASTPPTG
jgi:protein-S-isoprenylcysteine O-methyltransferase Ste14